MITEQSNGEKPMQNSLSLLEQVGGGVLDIVRPGCEHGPYFTKAVGGTALIVGTAIAAEMAWLWTLNTGAEQ